MRCLTGLETANHDTKCGVTQGFQYRHPGWTSQIVIEDMRDIA